MNFLKDDFIYFIHLPKIRQGLSIRDRINPNAHLHEKGC